MLFMLPRGYYPRSKEVFKIWQITITCACWHIIKNRHTEDFITKLGIIVCIWGCNNMIATNYINSIKLWTHTEFNYYSFIPVLHLSRLLGVSTPPCSVSCWHNHLKMSGAEKQRQGTSKYRKCQALIEYDYQSELSYRPSAMISLWRCYIYLVEFCIYCMYSTVHTKLYNVGCVKIWIFFKASHSNTSNVRCHQCNPLMVHVIQPQAHHFPVHHNRSAGLEPTERGCATWQHGSNTRTIIWPTQWAMWCRLLLDPL